jgi:thymidylate synthase (FAD)
MLLVKPRVELMSCTPKAETLIELAARTCYKSEDLITKQSSEQMIQKLIKSGHESQLEHASMSMRFICDRGVSHEIVRHRLFSYSQESTRYCDYTKKGIAFIIPCWLPSLDRYAGVVEESSLEYYNVEIAADMDALVWLEQMSAVAQRYQHLIDFWKWSPQQARSVLPNSLKTDLVVTGNFREWRHFFKLRLAKAAHPQMHEVARKALLLALSVSNNVFKDLIQLSAE